MTDYVETQLEELEVLESIWPEEYKEVSLEPIISFSITLRPENAAADGPAEELCLEFEFPSTYPDVPPEITVSGTKVQPQLITKLKRELDELAKENVGDVMIFVIASQAKEWLDTRMDDFKVEIDNKNTDEELKKLKEKEWLAGTAVTKENFAAWAAKFEAEQDKLRAKKMGGTASADEKLKATRRSGKELFQSGDKALLTSELALLDEGDEGIDVAKEHQLEIDESLFEDKELEKLTLKSK
eukprot:CFRG3805T1